MSTPFILKFGDAGWALMLPYVYFHRLHGVSCNETCIVFFNHRLYLYNRGLFKWWRF